MRIESSSAGEMPALFEENVDAAVRRNGLVVERNDALLVGDVDFHEEAVDLLGDLGSVYLVKVRHDDARPFGRELACRGATNAAGGTRNDRHLVVQTSHHSSVEINTFFSSLKLRSASGPSSRPIPDCLYPPKGVE